MTEKERLNTYSSDFDIFAQAFFEKAKEIYKSEKYNEQDGWRSYATIIILSVASIEAYINGYSTYHVYDNLIKSNQVETSLIDFLLEKNMNVNLDTKLLVWTKLITGKTFDKSIEPWGSYKTIRKLRDKLIHSKIKPVDSQKIIESFRDYVIPERNWLFWEPNNYNEVNKDNAKKALETVVNIVNKLREFSNWGKPEPNFDGYKLNDI
ncbi:hypothetical protein ES705_11737 [subsurface metagenome]